jgi:hypothetical protein
MLVFYLKGDWNVNPPEAVQANLSLLLDKSEAARPLWALFTSIDVFSLAGLLLAVSASPAARRPARLLGRGDPRLLIVLVKVGWATLF